MFGVGLHFSVADLLAVRRVAVPAAFVHMGIGTLCGIVVADDVGLAVRHRPRFRPGARHCEQVVLLRAFKERKELETPTGSAAVGLLVVEGLVIVLALVLLPAVASALGGQARTSAAVQAASGDLPLKLTVLYLLALGAGTCLLLRLPRLSVSYK